MAFIKGQDVKLDGINGKGKNRIRENGDTWKVIGMDQDALLVESKKNPDCARWVLFQNDPVMKIVEGC